MNGLIRNSFKQSGLKLRMHVNIYQHFKNSACRFSARATGKYLLFTQSPIEP